MDEGTLQIVVALITALLGSGGVLATWMVRKARHASVDGEETARVVAATGLVPDWDQLVDHWQEEVREMREDLEEVKRELVTLRRAREDDSYYIGVLREHIYQQKPPPPPERPQYRT